MVVLTRSARREHVAGAGVGEVFPGVYGITVWRRISPVFGWPDFVFSGERVAVFF